MFTDEKCVRDETKQIIYVYYEVLRDTKHCVSVFLTKEEKKVKF